jgi:hypothetical protein
MQMAKRVLCKDNLSRIITHVLKEEFGDYSFRKANSCIDSYQFGKLSKDILQLSKRLSVINYLGILSQKDMDRISMVLDDCKKICHTINKRMYDLDSMRIKSLVIRLVKNLKLFTDASWFKYSSDNEEFSRFLLQGRIVYEHAYWLYKELK